MKYALITGGSRGIGRSVSIKLAAMGYTVLINYQSNDKEAANMHKEDFRINPIVYATKIQIKMSYPFVF